MSLSCADTISAFFFVWQVHTNKSGVAHGAFENDLDAMTAVRELIGFLPSSNAKAPPKMEV